MLPDCVGVWYPSCSSWVKSESLNRRYLIKLLFFDHLSFNKKKQKANCGDKQKEI